MDAKEGFIYNSNHGFITFSAEKIIFSKNKNGSYTKKPKGLPRGWQNFTEDNFEFLFEKFKLKSHELICVQTGKKSNISVFDFDIEDTYNEIAKRFPQIKDHYTVKTKRGYHVYFLYDARISTSTNVFKNHPGVDIRNENAFVYAPGTKYEHPDGSIVSYDYIYGDLIEMPDELFDLFENHKEEIPCSEIACEPCSEIACEPCGEIAPCEIIEPCNEIEKLCDIISIEYLTDFDHWRKIIWALHKEDISEEFARQISKKADNYEDGAFNNIWKVPNNNKLSAGTIHYYAKLSNIDKYFQIMDYCKKIAIHDMNDKSFVDLVISEMSEDFVCVSCVNGKISYYTWYNDAWYYNNDCITRIKISEYICSIMTGIINHHRKLLLSGTENQEKHNNIIKHATKCIQKVCNYKSLANILSYFKDSLARCIEHDDFDKSIPDVVKFKNTAINVMTGEKFIIEKHHRITQSTLYDYVESTKEQLKEMDKIWSDIFPDPEIKKCYLSVMKQSFTARREEKFYMANGCGRNGKGLLNELALNTLGPQYSLKGNISVLTQAFKKELNVSLSEMNKKRFVIFNEPNDGVDKLQLGNIKAITGDGIINGRSIYSTDTTVNMVSSIVFECNQKPDIQGRVDNAIISRFVNVPFDTYFTDDPNELNLQNAKMINKTYKSSSFQSEYKTVLFDYVVKYADNELYIPDQVVNTTRSYLYNADEFLTWFNDQYEPCEDGVITAKQIYAHYKLDFFPELSKSQRRALPEKKFKENNIMANIELKKYYFDRKKIKNVEYRSVIVGYKKRAKLMCDEFGIPMLDEFGKYVTLENIDA